MTEKLYEIPVNDAFSVTCECPICVMYQSLQADAIEFVMGSSYMDDHIRMQTNKLGFCSKHLKMMYENQNRLGLALMLQTHMEQMEKDLHSAKNPCKRIKQQQESCFVCDKIQTTLECYLSTVVYLYKTKEEFRSTFLNSNGFCFDHYRALYEKGSSQLIGPMKKKFLNDLNQVFHSNIERVYEDLSWFIERFDYRYKDAPIKNSKDAVIRAMQKTVGIENNIKE